MEILLLGGTGYLGSKIAERFLNAGNHVVSTRRKQTAPPLLKSNSNYRIEWIEATMTSIMASMKENKYDIVINSVCNYGRNHSLDDDVLEANLSFPAKVLSAAVVNGVNRFLTVGTGLPFDLNIYSFSKKMLADIGRFYSEKVNLAFYNICSEMFYGVDEPEDRFLPRIIRKMLNGEDIEMTEGTQHRDIIDVEDVVEAINMVVGSDLCGYHDIPVGTGTAPSISEIVDYIWSETGKKSVIHKGAVAMRPNEPDCVADTSILKALGEWKPIPWKQGIKNVIMMKEEAFK